MDKLVFFDLIFEQHNPTVSKAYAAGNKRPGVTSETTVAEEFNMFFYRHNLTALFTNEHRTQPITVGLIDAQSVLKNKGKANKLLKDFSNWLTMAQDNKKYEEAVFKILYESRTWQGFLKQIQDHLNYLPYITDGYTHNTWNIVFYDKDKSGTKVSKGI